SGKLAVVWDRRMRPAGREPLSRSSSHSWPRMQLQPAVMVAVEPGASEAIDVLRHSRRRLNAYGTVIAVYCGPLTVKICPATAFSGRPPSAGGLKRGSRHVPVHTLGIGSIFALACVSL